MTDPQFDSVIEKEFKTPLFSGTPGQVCEYLAHPHGEIFYGDVLIRISNSEVHMPVDEYLEAYGPHISRKFDQVLNPMRDNVFMGTRDEVMTWLKAHPGCEDWRVRVATEMNTYSVHDYLLM